jgi:hypothetical protein
LHSVWEIDRNLEISIVINTMFYSAADGKEKINSDYKLPKDSEYICDLCMERFENPKNLHEHRTAKHKASTE